MNIKGPEDRSETAINEYQLAAHQRPPPSILMAKGGRGLEAGASPDVVTPAA